MNPQKERCLTGTAATIESLLGVPAGPGAKDAPLAPVLESAGHAFGAPRADRVFFYNPDAVARWVVAKRAREFAPLVRRAGLQLPLHSVLPPVTPVCFASMYSGLLPAAHGIQSYVKPVLQVPTVFDTLPAAGRRAAIVSTAGDSISMIFLGRPVDYFIYKTVAECNAKALALIDADEYDFLVLYNGDYDHWMHRNGPEGPLALRALRGDLDTFERLRRRILERWQEHDTVLAFAPDHGCHRVLGLLGSHGIDAPCDLEITHFYCFLPRRSGSK